MIYTEPKTASMGKGLNLQPINQLTHKLRYTYGLSWMCGLLFQNQKLLAGLEFHIKSIDSDGYNVQLIQICST